MRIRVALEGHWNATFAVPEPPGARSPTVTGIPLAVTEPLPAITVMFEIEVICAPTAAPDPEFISRMGTMRFPFKSELLPPGPAESTGAPDGAKFAATFFGPVIVTPNGFVVLLTSPLNEANWKPDAAAAVSVADVPASNHPPPVTVPPDAGLGLAVRKYWVLKFPV